MNLYAHVGNDPINMTDPTGMYGRGTGWSDEDWEKFDAAQQQAASDMSASASAMRKEAAGLKDGAANGDGYSASELNSMANDLDAGAAALYGSKAEGYVANAVGSLKDNRLAEATIGGKDVSVNVNHTAFGNNRNSSYFGHESLHSAGLEDYYQGKFAAYKDGSPFEKNVYRYLSKYQRGMRHKNPDNIMSQVYP